MAATATVVEVQNEIVGYQISTANARGGHLARLAIDPNYQGRGIGRVLLSDLLEQFSRWGSLNVTVNTQVDNVASLALYENAGFRRTGEIYPVYQSILNGDNNG